MNIIEKIEAMSFTELKNFVTSKSGRKELEQAEKTVVFCEFLNGNKNTPVARFAGQYNQTVFLSSGENNVYGLIFFVSDTEIIAESNCWHVDTYKKTKRGGFSMQGVVFDMTCLHQE